MRQLQLQNVVRRWRPAAVVVLLVALIAVALGAEQSGDEPANVRRRTISRKTTPLGGSIFRRLIGNRTSIRKSPYPYAERSFSSRASSVSSSLREQHEQAFGSASQESSSPTNSVVGTLTNQLEQARTDGQ